MKKTAVCPNCGHEELLDFADSVLRFYEMDGCTGYQVEYEVEKKHVCCGCGAELTSFGSFWEYPEGTIHMAVIRTI